MKDNSNTKGLDLNLISVYRNELFGLAIISIILFHYSYDVWHGVYTAKIDISVMHGLKYSVLLYYYLIRSIGVELFLFLSGMGLWYSMSENGDVKRFYKKRMQRVLIPYFIVALAFWSARDLYFQDGSLIDVIKDTMFITLFTDGTHMIWFICLILILYLIFPPIFMMLSDEEHRDLYFAVLMIITIAVPIVYSIIDHDQYLHTSIATIRIPIFILGCYMGRLIKEHAVMPRTGVILIISLSMVARLFFLDNDLSALAARFIAGIYSFGLLLLLVVLLHLMRHADRFNSFLSAAGRYSLELYIVHVSLRNLVKQTDFNTYDPLVYAIIIACSVPLSVGLNKLCGYLTESSYSRHPSLPA